MHENDTNNNEKIKINNNYETQKYMTFTVSFNLQSIKFSECYYIDFDAYLYTDSGLSPINTSITRPFKLLYENINEVIPINFNIISIYRALSVSEWPVLKIQINYVKHNGDKGIIEGTKHIGFKEGVKNIKIQLFELKNNTKINVGKVIGTSEIGFTNLSNIGIIV